MGRNAHRSGAKLSRIENVGRQSGGRKTKMQAETDLGTGQGASAVARARQVLRKDPEHVPALETLAKAQWQSADLDDLLATLRKLIALNPYEPGYHSLLAAAYHSKGLCGEAVKAYLRAVELGLPESSEMDALIQELRAWQGSLVMELIQSDRIFRAAYEQDPVKACAERGFDFAVVSETTEEIIQERATRAGLFARPS